MEDRERIFERFARGHGRGPAVPARAPGLGLAIVAETATRHGGAAWCADAPDGGARFCLSAAGGGRVSRPSAPLAAVGRWRCSRLTGCGVPTSGEPTTIPASDVPYGLAVADGRPRPAARRRRPCSPRPASTSCTPRTSWCRAAASCPAGPLEERLDDLLGAAGDRAVRRRSCAEELSTALPPGGRSCTSPTSPAARRPSTSPGRWTRPTGAESRLAVAPDRADGDEPARGATRCC